MKRKKKIILYCIISLFIAFLVSAVYVGYNVYIRACWFSLEDNIVHAYYPVVEAIEKYKSENGSLPASLDNIVPQYLNKIPQMAEIISVNYNKNSKANSYRLMIMVKFKGTKREFLYLSNSNLTEEEEKRVYTGCHGWEILRIKN